mmetsp:Transcript_131738/g.357735  ORF Transcript_131738/g.357735 Transcript_131738/m.357735 type:complete len:223 (+) Transcript_131738:1777-2445(+)
MNSPPWMRAQSLASTSDRNTSLMGCICIGLAVSPSCVNIWIASFCLSGSIMRAAPETPSRSSCTGLTVRKSCRASSSLYFREATLAISPQIFFLLPIDRQHLSSLDTCSLSSASASGSSEGLPSGSSARWSPPWMRIFVAACSMRGSMQTFTVLSISCSMCASSSPRALLPICSSVRCRIFLLRLSIIICFVPEGLLSFRYLTSAGHVVAFTTRVMKATPAT